MLKVNYKYIKGFLFVNLEGTLNSNNMYELSNSLRQIIKWNGIDKVVLNIEKVIALSDRYIKYIIEDLSDINIYLEDYNY